MENTQTKKNGRGRPKKLGVDKKIRCYFSIPLADYQKLATLCTSCDIPLNVFLSRLTLVCLGNGKLIDHVCNSIEQDF